MRILLATDAWEPQVNGVVRTLSRTVAECRAMGHEVEVVHPGLFKTAPLPTYPEIKLAIGAYVPTQELFKGFEPDAIHISTEGPIGLARVGSAWNGSCRSLNQLSHAVSGICVARVARAAGEHRLRLYALVPRAVRAGDGGHAHQALGTGAAGVPQHLALGAGRGHGDVHAARRGRGARTFRGAGLPVFLNVVRVAVEKNIEAFLAL
jgi:hypothetical protein